MAYLGSLEDMQTCFSSHQEELYHLDLRRSIRRRPSWGKPTEGQHFYICQDLKHIHNSVPPKKY